MASNRINRYRTMYERLVRPNNASVFPRHVFVRAANLHPNVYDRVGDRYAFYCNKISVNNPSLGRTASKQL